MHALGAIIGGKNTDEAEDIIAPWSEWVDMPEHVVQTRSEFLAECHGHGMELIGRHVDHVNDMQWRKTMEDATGRLALADSQAFEIYAERSGLRFDENGNVVSTFNEDSFYDYYVFGGRWSDAVADIQGTTCRELAVICAHDERTRMLVDSLNAICWNGFHEGTIRRAAARETVARGVREHPDERIWFIDFHD